MSRRGKRLAEREIVRVCFEMDWETWNAFKGRVVKKDTSMRQVMMGLVKAWLVENP